MSARPELTPRPALWQRRKFGGPREWRGWTMRLFRVGPFVLSLSREEREPGYGGDQR